MLYGHAYLMRRSFAFGCSFTNYWRWPTWADCLGKQADWFENWGICGGGNQQILYNLMECHQRHRIGPNDSVYIMWTNVSREDRYVRNRWLEGGNVYWGSVMGEDYVRRFACERGYTIRDMAVIAAVRDLLKAWGCEWRMFAMVPLLQSNQLNQLGKDPTGISDLQDIYLLYEPVFKDVAPSVYETVFDSNWFSGQGIPDAQDAARRDFHPTPREHLLYLEKAAPDIEIDRNARQWMLDWHDRASAGDCSWSEQNFGPRQRL